MKRRGVGIVYFAFKMWFVSNEENFEFYFSFERRLDFEKKKIHSFSRSAEF